MPFIDMKGDGFTASDFIASEFYDSVLASIECLESEKRIKEQK